MPHLEQQSAYTILMPFAGAHKESCVGSVKEITETAVWQDRRTTQDGVLYLSWQGDSVQFYLGLSLSYHLRQFLLILLGHELPISTNKGVLPEIQ